jgi:hypothetical protein
MGGVHPDSAVVEKLGYTGQQFATRRVAAEP